MRAELKPEASPTMARLGASGLTALLATTVIALIPTFGTLGYPSALLMSPFFALAGARLGLRQLPPSARPVGATLAMLAGQALRRIAWLWASALGILLISSLWQGNADLAFGLACFALGPVSSSVLGWLCGLIAGAAGDRRVLRALIAFGPFVGSFALALYRLYVDPVVFGFDPFWGMFSGGIYDQDTEIGTAYLAYRLFNAGVATGILILFALAYDPTRARLTRARFGAARRAHPFALMLSLALLATGTWIATRPERFGFHQTAANLARMLGARSESEHFVLHYRQDSANAREIEAITDELELWWRLHAQRLSETPEPPIVVFLFDSAMDKRELLGVGRAEIAAPWRGEIYLQHRPDPHPALPHELAHAFGAPFGDSIFGVARRGLKINGGLIEGFAEALGGAPHAHLDVHERAAILARLELRPPLAVLFGPSFWAVAPARAYDAAGSFCSWIVQNHGLGALEQLYRSGGDFDTVLGTPLEALEAEWIAFLHTVPVADDDLARERRRFERRSVFQRPHAYRVARLFRGQARALENGDLERATSIQQEIRALEPEILDHRLGRARLLASAGEFGAAYDEVRELLDEAELPNGLRAAGLETKGDLLFIAGDLDGARRAYAAAAARASNVGGSRTLALKQHAASDPELAPLWLRYLAPFSMDAAPDDLIEARLEAALELHRMEGERALAAYLAARQHLNRQDLEAAWPLLEESLVEWEAAADSSLRGFEHAARELGRLVAARLGKFGRAHELQAALVEGRRGAGDRLRNERWESRLQFLERRAD